MGTTSIVGMEVPYISSNSVKWVEASVPDMPGSVPNLRPVAPPTEDYASCAVIGTPPTYLIWYPPFKLLAFYSLLGNFVG